MIFPDTPITLIGRLNRREVAARIWEASWEEFFDLYHRAAQICVRRTFYRYGWQHLSEDVAEEVTLRVFTSIFRGSEGAGFDPSKGRFRQFLSSVCQRRVVDHIRAHKNEGLFSSIDVDGAPPLHADDPFARAADEAFDDAVLGVLLAALRTEVSPRVYLIFELVKLAGEDPVQVSEQLGVRRAVVDNSIFKAMKKLREIAQSPEIAKELNS